MNGNDYEKSYFTGVIITDGYMRAPNRFELEAAQKKFVDKFAEIAERIGLSPNRYQRTRSHKNNGTEWRTKTYRAVCYDKKFYKKYSEKELEEHITDYWAFLEAITDSDGCYDCQENFYISKQKSSDYFELIKSVLDRLSIDYSYSAGNFYIKTESREVLLEKCNPVIRNKPIEEQRV